MPPFCRNAVLKEHFTSIVGKKWRQSIFEGMGRDTYLKVHLFAHTYFPADPLPPTALSKAHNTLPPCNKTRLFIPLLAGIAVAFLRYGGVFALEAGGAIGMVLFVGDHICVFIELQAGGAQVVAELVPLFMGAEGACDGVLSKGVRYISKLLH